MLKFLNLKNTSLALMVSIIICSAVCAATYKIPSKSNTKTNYSNSTTQSQNYNVYTPSNYTNPTTVNNGVQQGSIVEIVIDYSGSMATSIEQVKQTVLKFFPYLPSSTKIGLRVFGQEGGVNPYATSNIKVNVLKRATNVYKLVRQTKEPCIGNTSGVCSQTVMVLPVGNYSNVEFFKAMYAYQTGSSTPLVYGLSLAVEKDLAPFQSVAKKKIILITDGGENCGGDPCAYVKKLMQTRKDIVIDVILTSYTDAKTYACVANETGGKLYQNGIFDFNSLSNDLMQSIQTSPNTSIPQQTPQQNTNVQTPQGQNYEYIPD